MSETAGSLKQYFATLNTEEIGQELVKRIDTYYKFVQSSGHFDRIRKSYRSYYGYSPNGNSSSISSIGAQGEYSGIVVNDFRSILLNILNMTTASRPAFDVHATNSDHESQAQAILGKGLLDYYLRRCKLERDLKKATEFALVMGEGFVKATWDSTSGDQYGTNPDTGAIIYNGDLKYTVQSPLDVIRDITKDNADMDWCIVREFVNKFDLAARYPDLAEEILRVTNNTQLDNINMSVAGMQDSDLIPVYEFYHRSTDSVPNGRLVQFVDSKTVLFDGPLPYRSVPVYRISPSDQAGSPFGYSSAFDLLGISDASSTLYSTVLTNQTTFGVQNILVPKGSDLSVQELSGGLNMIEYNPNLKPEPLNLTQTPPEIFNFINILDKKMETLSGVNSVARGNPDASLKSGTALALVQSMAIQFNNGLAGSYAQLLEDVGLATLQMLMDFASVPRVAMIAGKTSSSLMKDFSGKDLQNISRVSVDMGNPLMRTIAGRVEMANTLIQTGLITHVAEYVEVVASGSLDPLTEGDVNELMNIRAENEWLADGKPSKAIFTDAHALHIQEHKTVVGSPEARQNPQILQATLDHIQEHMGFLQNTDPNLLQLLGQKPIAPPPPQQSPPSAPQQQAMNHAPQMLNATNPVTQQAAQVGMPRMPVSPLKPQN